MDSTIVTSIKAYGKKCMGCLMAERDIMIAYTCDNGENIINLFLTQDQAKFLANEITEMIEYNNK